MLHSKSYLNTKRTHAKNNPLPKTYVSDVPDLNNPFFQNTYVSDFTGLNNPLPSTYVSDVTGFNNPFFPNTYVSDVTALTTSAYLYASCWHAKSPS